MLKSVGLTLLFLTLLVPASLYSNVSATTEEPEAPTLQILNGQEAPQDIPLKAVQTSAGNIEPEDDYSVEPENVILIERGKNFILMPSSGTVTKVEAVDAQLNEIPLSFTDSLVRTAELPSAAYVLSVIIQADNGDKYGFVTFLVILQPTQTISQVNIQNIINSFSSRNIDTRIIFEDDDGDNGTPDPEPPEDEPSICFFEPNNEACNPDENGNCPEGFGMNEDGQCIPQQSCPEGFHRANDDETGRCIDEDELRECENNGGWVEEGEFCPEDELPICNEDRSNEPCISGQEETEPENDPCNYYGTDVCIGSGEERQCDSQRFDCLSDCEDGTTRTTGQCPGDDEDRTTPTEPGTTEPEPEPEPQTEPQTDPPTGNEEEEDSLSESDGDGDGEDNDNDENDEQAEEDN